MEFLLRIHHQDQFVDIPASIIERHRSSPLYYCLKNFPNETIFFNNICTNINVDLTFGLFLDMCDVVCDRCPYYDASKKVRDLLKLFNLVDPVIEKAFDKNHLATHYECDMYHRILYQKGSFIQLPYDVYEKLYNQLDHQKIVPVQIYWQYKMNGSDELSGSDDLDDTSNYYPLYINIYDGLPIYFSDEKHKFVFGKDHVINNTVDINAIRKKIYTDYLDCGNQLSMHMFSNDVRGYMQNFKFHCNNQIKYVFPEANIPVKIFNFPVDLDIDKVINDIINIVSNATTSGYGITYGFVHLP